MLRASSNLSWTEGAKMLDPDYYKVLLEIGVGRRFWQSNPSAENAHAFYVRVVRPLRQLQRRGVVEKLQEITPTDDRTLIAVEIIGQSILPRQAKIGRDAPNHLHQPCKDQQQFSKALSSSSEWTI
jgi:hypothetical protein